MSLCACGCGLPANPELGAFVDYQHAGRYERNGRRAVPLPPANEPGIRVALRCPHCGRKMRGAVCSVSTCRAPARINWKALSAAVGGNADPYPLETTSADVTLANPCSTEEVEHRRQLERGLTRVVCPGCQGVAWQEPPCWVNGVERVVIRCRACASQRKCVGCGVRPPRYRRDLCTECVREKREETETMAATAEKSTEKLCCKYCGGEIKLRPQDRNTTRITCGSKDCSKKHINFLSSGKKKGARAINGTPPAPIKSSAAAGRPSPPPDEPTSTGPPASREHMAGPLGVIPTQAPQGPERTKNVDLVMAAVLALEAIPAGIRADVLRLLDARERVVQAEAEANALLRELAGCAS